MVLCGNRVFLQHDRYFLRWLLRPVNMLLCYGVQGAEDDKLRDRDGRLLLVCHSIEEGSFMLTRIQLLFCPSLRYHYLNKRKQYILELRVP
jgi:hypothetical protein